MRYLILLSVFLLSTTNGLAQCKYGGESREILRDRPFKIKAVSGVSSSTAREADYVEFRTMEDVYVLEKEPRTIFAKDTPIFGLVTRRKHRHFPFFGGHIELRLEPLLNWDRQPVHIAIARHGPIDQSARGESKKARKARNNPCKKDKANFGEEESKNCIAGRRNPSVAPIVPAVAAGGTAALAAVTEEEETRFIAATSFFSIAKDIGELLNGTDADISKDEIFDMYIAKGSFVCVLPEKEKEK